MQIAPLAYIAADSNTAHYIDSQLADYSVALATDYLYIHSAHTMSSLIGFVALTRNGRIALEELGLQRTR